MLGVKRVLSTAYQPQTDGQTEMTNQVLEGHLRTFVNYDKNDWYQLLPLAEPAYNNWATHAHQMTPFFANYRFHPQGQLMKEREAQNPGVTLYVHWTQAIHRQAKQTLENTRESMKKVLQQKSDGTTQHRGKRLANVACKEHTYQTTIREGEPETVRPFQSVRKEGKLGIQVRTIAAVENSFCVSRFAIGTVSSLEPTKSQTTPTRPRRDQGGFRVGGRKDCQE